MNSSTTEVVDRSSPQNVFGEYLPGPTGAYDEAIAADGTVRPPWQSLARQIDLLGREELARRQQQAELLVRENGVTYNAYGDPDQADRPWNLDVVPLLFGTGQWQELSTALIQRARLLNLVLADLYGPQRLIRDGILPPEVIYAHPGYFRSLHGQQPPNQCFLHLYVADLARSPDGSWWVVADRTDAPLGMGYTLENRVILSRTLPHIFQENNVQRLAAYFIALRETLQQMAPRHRENPRIVLLSQGPHNPNYFEDAYLARYLGYILAEAGDLTVRDNRVLLKTLSGLLPVEVILRRLSDRQSDPLELRGDASLGVPGLVQVAHSGHVVLANALGSSLVESPLLMAFLPQLSDALLSERLQLPSVATWWCGAEDARRYVLDQLDRLMVRSAFRSDRQDVIRQDDISGKSREELIAAITAAPNQFVAQQRVCRSTVPSWSPGGFQALHSALRVFVVASGDSYRVMPGGLVRVAATSRQLDHSVLAGTGSKDVWVPSDGPVSQATLLQSPDQPVEIRRSGADLPSRVADNLFWLGRHTERAESSARLLRTVLVRLTSEEAPRNLPELPMLLRGLADQGQIEPGFVVDGIRDQLPTIEQFLPASVLDAEQPGSLRSTLAAMSRLAGQVRDRISIDGWRIISRIEEDLHDHVHQGPAELSEVLTMVNQMLIDLSAIGGLAMESMTRAQGWRFLDLGRRLDRSLHVMRLVQHVLASPPEDDGAVLEAALEVADSQMTYRGRYLRNLHLPAVLDLLLTDETNPRSLAFQLVAIAADVDDLPRDRAQPFYGPEQRIAMATLNGIRMLDVEALAAARRQGEKSQVSRLLVRLTEQITRLSDLVSHKYLVHAGAPRRFN